MPERPGPRARDEFSSKLIETAQLGSCGQGRKAEFYRASKSFGKLVGVKQLHLICEQVAVGNYMGNAIPIPESCGPKPNGFNGTR